MTSSDTGLLAAQVGYLATPVVTSDRPQPWPGVVLVHEAYGVNEVMRRQVAHVASLGYVALMPDLFSDGGVRRCLGPPTVLDLTQESASGTQR